MCKWYGYWYLLLIATSPFHSWFLFHLELFSDEKRNTDHIWYYMALVEI